MRRLLIVSILLAACGDDGSRHILDAPLVQPDGPSIDAAPAPVTLTVTRAGLPQPNINVYFQNADSHLVAMMHTDTTGVASAVMAAGGFVTAIDPFVPPLFGKGPHDDLFTFAGVKPGDHLVLDQPATLTTSITISLPGSTGVGVTQYTITTTCNTSAKYDVARLFFSGSGSPPSTVVYLTNCSGPSDVVVAAETTNGRPVQYFYLHDQTFTDGQTIDWTAQLYTDAVVRDYSYTTVPAGATGFDLTDYVKTAHGLAYAGYGGVGSGGATTTEQLTLPTFSGVADMIEADLQTSAFTKHAFIDWGPQTTPFTTDVGARIMHEFTDYPSQSITTPNAIVWDETTTGLPPDFMLGQVRTSRASDGHFWYWNYAGPYTAGTFVFPVLPTDVYDFNISATDTATFQQMLMGKIVGGYDAVRAHLFALIDGPQQLALGASGSVTVEAPTQNVTATTRTAPASWLQHVRPRPAQVLRHRRD